MVIFFNIVDLVHMLLQLVDMRLKILLFILIPSIMYKSIGGHMRFPLHLSILRIFVQMGWILQRLLNSMEGQGPNGYAKIVGKKNPPKVRQLF